MIQTELPESCCECRGGINNSRQLYFVDPELNVWFITQDVSDFYTFIQNMKTVKMPEWMEAKAHILQAGALVSAGVKQSSGIRIMMWAMPEAYWCPIRMRGEYALVSNAQLCCEITMAIQQASMCEGSCSPRAGGKHSHRSSMPGWARLCSTEAQGARLS